jgi:hypothetical protein
MAISPVAEMQAPANSVSMGVRKDGSRSMPAQLCAVLATAVGHDTSTAHDHIALCRNMLDDLLSDYT